MEKVALHVEYYSNRGLSRMALKQLGVGSSKSIFRFTQIGNAPKRYWIDYSLQIC